MSDMEVMEYAVWKLWGIFMAMLCKVLANALTSALSFSKNSRCTLSRLLPLYMRLISDTGKSPPLMLMMRLRSMSHTAKGRFVRKSWLGLLPLRKKSRLDCSGTPFNISSFSRHALFCPTSAIMSLGIHPNTFRAVSLSSGLSEMRTACLLSSYL